MGLKADFRRSIDSLKADLHRNIAVQRKDLKRALTMISKMTDDREDIKTVAMAMTLWRKGALQGWPDSLAHDLIFTANATSLTYDFEKKKKIFNKTALKIVTDDLFNTAS